MSRYGTTWYTNERVCNLCGALGSSDTVASPIHWGMCRHTIFEWYKNIQGIVPWFKAAEKNQVVPAGSWIPVRFHTGWQICRAYHRQQINDQGDSPELNGGAIHTWLVLVV